MCKLSVRKTLILCALTGARLLPAQTAPGRYALILDDAPVSERFVSRESMRLAEATTYQRQIAKQQNAIRSELISRRIQTTGSVNTVLNAIFVLAPQDQLAELKGLPGVKGVVAMKRYHMSLNRATQV